MELKITKPYQLSLQRSLAAWIELKYALSNLRRILATENPLKMMKNAS